MPIIGLLDCNNFYASCERVFDPSLRAKPVVILSNNDGCIIARSNEAKVLDIAMGVPRFKCEYAIVRHKVAERSANFTLYADMSQRVFSLVTEIMPGTEIYSIDEAFIQWDFDDMAKAVKQAKLLRATILRQTGIPVSIGLAQTKVLAKTANKLAKGSQYEHGVFAFTSENIEKELKKFKIEDLWGVGRAYQKILHQHSIKTAYDLQQTNTAWIKKKMGVQGLRLVHELNNYPCFEFKKNQQNHHRHSILSSRSFAKAVYSKTELKEAVANFVSTAAHKLRNQKLATQNIRVFLRSGSTYSQNKEYFSEELSLLQASNYTPDLMNAAMQIVDQLFIDGEDYRKAGVMLYSLVPASSVQTSLFTAQEEVQERNKLEKLIDQINNAMGKNTLTWGSSAHSKQHQSWSMRQEHRSPCYTTKWQDLPKVY